MFRSIFSNILNDFISYKRLCGCKYGNTQIQLLKRLDSLIIKLNVLNLELSEKIVFEYIKTNTNEKKQSQCSRINIIRQLAIFMTNNDKNAYYYNVKSFTPSQRNFTPYIYSDNEISRIFRVIDNIFPDNKSYIHLTYPVIYRILYCCGLRIGDVLNLKVNCIDIRNDLILIKNAKYDNDRLLPIHQSLSFVISKYMDNTVFNSEDDYLFPVNNLKEKYTVAGFYKYFRIILKKAGISHTSNGPRVYDFRHLFAIKCLNKFNGDVNIDVNVMLPILSTYLGHKSMEGTLVYLRLTPLDFDGILNKVVDKYGFLTEDTNE